MGTFSFDEKHSVRRECTHSIDTKSKATKMQLRGARARAGLNTYALLGILEGALGGVALDELDNALLVRGEAGNLADQGAHVRHALSEALKKETSADIFVRCDKYDGVTMQRIQ
jgi:hypothetical protein